jgi:predicted nucleic acid-binding protein
MSVVGSGLVGQRARVAGHPALAARELEDRVQDPERVERRLRGAAGRVNTEARPKAKKLSAQLDRIPLTSDVIDEAADVGDVMVRGLDAIHLASALSIRADLSAFVAYDHRLCDAASAAGLELLTPGRDNLCRAPGV